MTTTEPVLTRESRASAFASWASTGWGAFIIRRGGGLLLSLAVLTVVTFLIVPLLPGDPAAAILGTNATPASIAELREKLQLDDPIWVRFTQFLSGIFRIDLGKSFRFGTPVTQIIATKLPYTLTLAVASMAVILLVAVPLGMCVGVLTRGGRHPEIATTFSVIAGFLASVPGFVVGTVLIVSLSIGIRAFPPAGADGPASWVLPIAALSIGPIFAVARVVRQETDTVSRQEYMRTARGHRLSNVRLYLTHGLPNLLTSTLTLTGLILAGIIGGTVIIENVFNFPGVGYEIVQAIIFKDYPVVQGIILVIGTIAILINLAIDALLGAIDPRTLGGSHE